MRKGTLRSYKRGSTTFPLHHPASYSSPLAQVLLTSTMITMRPRLASPVLPGECQLFDEIIKMAKELIDIMAALPGGGNGKDCIVRIYIFKFILFRLIYSFRRPDRKYDVGPQCRNFWLKEFSPCDPTGELVPPAQILDYYSCTNSKAYCPCLLTLPDEPTPQQLKSCWLPPPPLSLVRQHPDTELRSGCECCGFISKSILFLYSL